MITQELVKIRKEKKIKQKELARRLGITTSHLCLIEKGRIEPKVEIVMRIVEQLGYKVLLVRNDIK